jgi:hypothetical protein
VIWAILTLIRGAIVRFGSSALAFLAPTMGSSWALWPWAQIVVAFIALFVLFCGWALIRQQRWSQTLMVPAHLIFAIYAFAVWVGMLVSSGHPYQGWAPQSMALLSAIAANGLLAAWMNSVGTSEALSWLPLRTAPLIPLKCEFCGTPLTPSTGRCPQCQAEPQIAQNAPRRPPNAVLVGTTDEHEFHIGPDRTITVGRGSTRNEINLSNPTVSRRHAQIAFEEGRYMLKALDDRNGTFVNGARVRQQTLQDGDEIRFGRASYGFRIVE